MTLQELKEQCLKASLGMVVLVIPRKSPPSSDYIRVKGFGKGYVLNAQNRGEAWEIVAQFKVAPILKTIEEAERAQAAWKASDDTREPQ